MTKELSRRIEDEEWYIALIEECKAIITEAVFTSRWALVEGYHQLGTRILEENNLDRSNIYGKKIVQGLAQSFGMSERTLWYALKFAEKYPKLNEVPEGKNITWNKVITKYLPEPTKEVIPLPEGKYQIIYADPPWEYEFCSDPKDEIELKYPTMRLEDIKSLKLNTAEDCVLLLWATAPKLEEAVGVINSWGFKYRTCAVWDKEWIAMGYWFRNQHELLLVGIKGNPKVPEQSNRFSSVIREKRTKHSKKPDIVYEMIEKMFPNQNYLELFARNKRKGWNVWGNDVK